VYIYMRVCRLLFDYVYKIYIYRGLGQKLLLCVYKYNTHILLYTSTHLCPIYIIILYLCAFIYICVMLGTRSRCRCTFTQYTSLCMHKIYGSIFDRLRLYILLYYYNYLHCRSTYYAIFRP